jgi:hypothetical protein
LNLRDLFTGDKDIFDFRYRNDKKAVDPNDILTPYIDKMIKL